MKRRMRIFLAIVLVAAMALPLEGAWRDRTVRQAETGVTGSSLVPPGASWQALFHAAWR